MGFFSSCHYYHDGCSLIRTSSIGENRVCWNNESFKDVIFLLGLLHESQSTEVPKELCKYITNSEVTLGQSHNLRSDTLITGVIKLGTMREIGSPVFCCWSSVAGGRGFTSSCPCCWFHGAGWPVDRYLRCRCMGTSCSCLKVWESAEGKEWKGCLKSIRSAYISKHLIQFCRIIITILIINSTEIYFIRHKHSQTVEQGYTILLSIQTQQLECLGHTWTSYFIYFHKVVQILRKNSENSLGDEKLHTI